MADTVVRVDSRSSRKTAHVIVGEKERYGRTYAAALCGMYLWPAHLRPQADGEPNCVRCAGIGAKKAVVNGARIVSYDPSTEVVVKLDRETASWLLRECDETAYVDASDHAAQARVERALRAALGSGETR